jgi:hypothetical protein
MNYSDQPLPTLGVQVIEAMLAEGGQRFAVGHDPSR